MLFEKALFLILWEKLWKCWETIKIILLIPNVQCFKATPRESFNASQHFQSFPHTIKKKAYVVTFCRKWSILSWNCLSVGWFLWKAVENVCLSVHKKVIFMNAWAFSINAHRVWQNYPSSGHHILQLMYNKYYAYNNVKISISKIDSCSFEYIIFWNNEHVVTLWFYLF